MNSPVARYCEALLSAIAGLSSEEVASLFSHGERYATLLDDNEELRRFFLSPFFSFAEKKAVFTEIAERFELATPLRNLFLALLESRRPLLIGPVLRETQRRYQAAQGIVEIEVRSAVPLDEKTLGGLRPSLEKRWGKRILIRRVVDPAILGGVMVRCGNTIYDASLKNNLQLLADLLKKGERAHA